MFKRLMLFALLAALVLPVIGQDETKIQLANLMRPRLGAYAFNLNQNLRTTDSPTFAGLTIGTAHPVLDSGTVPLTAAWDAGEFGITALNLTADPTLGAELITNFAGWTDVADWAYGSSVWTHAATGATALVSDWTPTVNLKYKIIVTVTHTSGTGLVVSCGGQTFQNITATTTFYLTPPYTTALTFTPSADWVGSITAVSVKAETNGLLTSTTASITNGLTLGGGQIILPVGSATYLYPTISFDGHSTSGIYYDTSNNAVAFSFGGTAGARISGGGVFTMGPLILGAAGSWSYVYSESVAVVQFGYDDASPAAQTLKGADATGDDHAGGSLTIAGGRGTDTGVGGSVKIATAPAGAGGSNEGTLVDRVEVDSTGAIKHLGANSQATNIKQATVALTTTAAATATATNLIPAGSTVVGVTTRVTTAVTGDAGFTGFDIGHSATTIVLADQNAWGDNVTPTINETTDGTDTTVASPINFKEAADVVLTQRGGSTFSAGGVVRVTVHYISLTAPAT